MAIVLVIYIHAYYVVILHFTSRIAILDLGLMEIELG